MTSAADAATLFLSLKTATVATALAFFAGVGAAAWMAGREFRGKGVVEGLLLAPLVLPPTVIGFILVLLMGVDGPIGRLAVAVTGETLLFSWGSAVFAAAVVALPLIYRTARAALEQVDGRLADAARTLGATEGRVFREVLLPLARPGVVAGTLLGFARALGEFGATLMVAGNIPGRTRTLPLAIYSDVERGDMAHAGQWVGLMLLLGIGLATASDRLATPRKARVARRATRSVPRRGGESGLTQGQTLDAAVREEGSGVFLGRPPGDDSSALTSPQVSRPGYKVRPIHTFDARLRRASGDDPLSRERSLDAHVRKELPGFSLDVRLATRGRAVAVLGPSGAGKSLLLRCLAGLERPCSGRIVINDRVVFDAADRLDIPTRQRRVGHVFQSYALFPHLTVQDNIGFGLRHAADRKACVDHWLETMDLVPWTDAWPAQISGGQAQRVALARALAPRPDLLLLDEPLSALDTHLKSRVELALRDAVESFPGVTLMVTHSLDEAFRVCDDLVLLDGGRIIAAGDKHAIVAAPGSVAAAALTGCKNIAAARFGDGVARVDSWGLTLRWHAPVAGLTYLGLRAHHIIVSHVPGVEGAHSCRLVQASETPHRTTLRLLCEGGVEPLQAEISREAWEILRQMPAPWYVTVPVGRALGLKGAV